ncbi:hypothetical protein D9619_003930 [Psilocybe cf. subviscida]|uniref:Uncharacterized protein n=1 Tax=Psilocybe cf. subviscida TaxID=2480587 RepID=A0A8H5BRJ2_9AGAR|nr:hypothetical protein D9619_003930 [Psilocybe cf. subviscida]
MPLDHKADSPLYEALLKGDDDETYTHRDRKSRKNLPRPLLHLITAVQMVVIVVLLFKLRKPLVGNELYLYSPAEGAVQYEVKTFFFDLQDDISPFHQPPSPKLDQMWQDLYSFGSSWVKLGRVKVEW